MYEALFSFRVRKLKSKPKQTKPSQTANSDCPQRWIPRKPHPTGLLTYLGCFKLASGVPYAFDLVPDLIKTEPVNPRDALASILGCWEWTGIRPHVIADAGFSGKEMLTIINLMNCYLTLSINKQHKRWLFAILKRNCKSKSWLTLNKSDVIWSMYSKNPKTLHFLVTNAFSPSQLEDHPKQNNSDPFLPSDIVLLSKLSL